MRCCSSDQPLNSLVQLCLASCFFFNTLTPSIFILQDSLWTYHISLAFLSFLPSSNPVHQLQITGTRNRYYYILNVLYLSKYQWYQSRNGLHHCKKKGKKRGLKRIKAKYCFQLWSSCFLPVWIHTEFFGNPVFPFIMLQEIAHDSSTILNF